VISPAPSLSDGWSAAVEEGRPVNRCADVYRLGRSRLLSPAVVVGGARFSWEGVPLRLAF
jgi:hypothetical protein